MVMRTFRAKSNTYNVLRELRKSRALCIRLQIRKVNLDLTHPTEPVVDAASNDGKRPIAWRGPSVGAMAVVTPQQAKWVDVGRRSGMLAHTGEARCVYETFPSRII